MALALVLTACSSGSEPEVPIATVAVTPATSNREVGETVQLSVQLKDAAGNLLSGRPVSWSSSNASIASVSEGGLVTAHALGTATITAASGDKSGTAAVHVIPEPIASISVTPTNDTLLVGETAQVTATLRDGGGNIITDRSPAWSSSAPAVATVSQQGLVTAMSDGTASITATADGRSASATFLVLGPCSTALAADITVGATVNGRLETGDCVLFEDGTFGDAYRIMVTSATAVQIDMTSDELDSYLLLVELLPNSQLVLRAENDDIDVGVDVNSRLVFTLQAGAEYFILANSLPEPTLTGDYVLKVTAVNSVAGRVGGIKPGRTPGALLMRALTVPRRP